MTGRYPEGDVFQVASTTSRASVVLLQPEGPPIPTI